MAMARNRTQTSRKPNWRRPDVGRDIAGVDVGDGGDERRAEQ